MRVCAKASAVCHAVDVALCRQEIFDNGIKVRPDTVIDVWKGGWQDEIATVTASGLRAILSTPWYLNYIR